MTEPALEVHVGEGLSLPLSVTRIEDALRQVFAAEGTGEARISLAFVSDEEITRLNERYLGHAYPTDVIAFPLHHAGQPPFGDIYIGTEQAARQAAELGIPLEEELLRLTIHGTLHVLGYDHPAGEDRYESAMYHRQEELLHAVRAARPELRGH